MWAKDGRALEGIPNLWALSEGQGRNLKGWHLTSAGKELSSK
jgi:hypothetical protein